MKKMFYEVRKRWAVLAAAGAVALTGVALAFTEKTAEEPESGSTAVKVPLDESVVARGGMPGSSFAPIIKKVAPGVVKIETTTTIPGVSSQQFPWLDDPFWRRFFGGPSGPGGMPRQFGPQRQYGLGSGVIVAKDGYVLTNNHVVDNANEVKVTLADGREFTAKVVGRDPKSDIAVVKIDAKDLPVVPMADSDRVEVGDLVLAIGNPFGVGQTVTQGIISAKDRGNVGIEDYEDFLQTDAAINPGNSGGALVDIQGRLIGINTAILSRSGGNQGVGFAIPSNLAHSVMESLIRSGHVTRGYIGVIIQDLTPTLAREFKLKEPRGALVGDVMADGPAAKAGFKEGDVVLDYNGKPVPDGRHLRLTVAQTKPGTVVPVRVWRNGAARTLEVTIKPLPGSEELARNTGGKDNKDTGTLNGVTVADLDPQMRREFNIPAGIKGAVVTDVDPGSASAEAGLKAGDVILEINRQPVRSAEEAVRLTEHAKDKHTLVRVWDNGASHYVVVDETGQD